MPRALPLAIPVAGSTAAQPASPLQNSALIRRLEPRAPDTCPAKVNTNDRDGSKDHAGRVPRIAATRVGRSDITTPPRPAMAAGWQPPDLRAGAHSRQPHHPAQVYVLTGIAYNRPPERRNLPP